MQNETFSYQRDGLINLQPLRGTRISDDAVGLRDFVTNSITKTCPCNVYPLKPHFYRDKLGYAGVYLFFLFLLQNIDCGYSF